MRDVLWKLWLEDVFRVHEMVAAISSHVFALGIPLCGLAHVVRVFPSRFRVVDVVAVVVLDNAKNAIAEFLVEVDRSGVAFPDKEIHKEGVVRFRGLLEKLCENAAHARATGLGGNRESGYVSMPWQIMLRELEVIWRALNLAHDYTTMVNAGQYDGISIQHNIL